MVGETRKLSPIASRNLSHVLLVDDDPALVEALSGTLQLRLGHFTLETCTDGRAALICIQAKRYDAIISDVQMPHMNGLDLLAVVKQLHPETPFVLMSGHIDRASMAKALDAGASDFIAKPFDRDFFVSVVRRALKLSRLRNLLTRQRARIDRANDHCLRIAQELSRDTPPPIKMRCRWEKRQDNERTNDHGEYTHSSSARLGISAFLRQYSVI